MDIREQAETWFCMEGSTVISEHQFATHYLSDWHTITPLADGFWSFENLMLTRVLPPLTPMERKDMSAIINETAFRAFCLLQTNSNRIRRTDVLNAIETELRPSLLYIQRFSCSSQLQMENIDDNCRKEAGNLVFRLLHFFPGSTPTILRPTFSGCGLLSQCEGDVIKGACLYEVKAGERRFRVVDLRQLLTYTALAYANGSLSFQEIGLFSPRTGLAWKKSLEEVSYSLSGLRLTGTLSALVDRFSGVSASR